MAGENVFIREGTECRGKGKSGGGVNSRVGQRPARGLDRNMLRRGAGECDSE